MKSNQVVIVNLNLKIGKVDLICSVCGVVRKYKPNEAAKRKFPFKCRSCSLKTRSGEANHNWKGGKIKAICTKCGIEKYKAKWELDALHSKEYICVKCYAENAPTGNQSATWKGGPKLKIPRIYASGKDHPSWKPKVTMVCSTCGKQKEYQNHWAKKFAERPTPYQCAACQRKSYRGANSPHWKGGVTFSERPQIWDDKLRETIRLRDDYLCQVCGTNKNDRAFPIHHIDYDKHNCRPNNLITLCTSCHGKTQHKRRHWETLLKSMMEKRCNSQGDEEAQKSLRSPSKAPLKKAKDNVKYLQITVED